MLLLDNPLVEAIVAASVVLLLTVAALCARHLVALKTGSEAWRIMLAMTVFAGTEALARLWVWLWRELYSSGLNVAWLGTPYVLMFALVLSLIGSLGMVFYMVRPGERWWLYAACAAATAGALSYLI